MSHITRVIELDRAIYFEDDTSTSQGPREIVFKEHLVFIHVHIVSTLITSLVMDQHSVATPNNELIDEVDPEALDVVMDIPLRKSKRVNRPTISDDYTIYLQEHEYNVGEVLDPTTYREAIISPQYNFWIDAMKDEMISMSQNEV